MTIYITKVRFFKEIILVEFTKCSRLNPGEYSLISVILTATIAVKIYLDKQVLKSRNKRT
jgi:hypothetical protein